MEVLIRNCFTGWEITSSINIELRIGTSASPALEGIPNITPRCSYNFNIELALPFPQGWSHKREIYSEQIYLLLFERSLVG
jgi:hypothetical protein